LIFLSLNSVLQAAPVENPPTLHCIGPSQVSLDEEGKAIITPAGMVRSGDISNAVILIDGERRDTVFCEDAGTDVMVTVRDTITGQSCWAMLSIQDKLPPLITRCDTVRLTCQQDVPNLEVPDTSFQFTDNCADPPSVSSVDVRTDFGCDNVDFVAQITRQYTVLDDWGNSAQCDQVILFERLALADVEFPGDTMLACPVMDTLPETTGFPTINGEPINMSCGIVSWYEDSFGDAACPGEMKIIRTWMIMDWCFDPTPVSMIQRIDIIDTVGPVITCPVDFTLGTDSDMCSSDYVLPAIPAVDACSDEASIGYSVTINTVAGGPYDAGDEVVLPEGVNMITYTVDDGCSSNNTSQCTYEITVIDDDVPELACASSQVMLQADGQNLRLISSFNVIADDNCEVVSLQGRRMQSDCSDPDALILGDDVLFCCDDLGTTVLVEFVVTDAAGLTNACMINVEVLDKLPPMVSCPANVTDGTVPLIRRWYGEDVSGNIDSCDQMIFVIDTIDPTIVCPADLTILSPSDTVISNTGTASGSDLCDDDLTFASTSRLERTDCPTEFTLFRTWTATDDCNNSSSCTQVITVEDRSVVVLNVPDPDVEAACQSQGAIDSAFADWLDEVSFTGAVNPMLSDDNIQ